MYFILYIFWLRCTLHRREACVHCVLKPAGDRAYVRLARGNVIYFDKD